jgi:ribosome-associated heat shock protein Hsp15
VLKVAGFADRRGSAGDARVLYEDLSPVPAPMEPEPAAPAERDSGSGRPTKRDRRAIGRFKGEDRQ